MVLIDALLKSQWNHGREHGIHVKPSVGWGRRRWEMVRLAGASEDGWLTSDGRWVTNAGSC